jgi:hypothetical protein
LGTHRAAWQDLLDRSASAEVFQTPEFLSAWLDVFWRGRPVSLLFAYRESTLVGLLPLLEDRAGEYWCGGSLVAPVDGHARRFTLLWGGAELRSVLREFLVYLRNTRPRSRIALPQVDTGGATMAILTAAAGDMGLHVTDDPFSSSPLARLDGTWESFLTSRSRHVRSELRRKMRKAERQGIGHEIVTREGDWEAGLRDMCQVEGRAWQNQTSEAMTFYDRLARSCASRPWLRLHFLRSGGQPIAYVFGLAYRGTMYAFRTAYDQRFASLAPGSVLFGHALREAIERGDEVFDFLGVGSRWKDELATGQRSYRNVCVFPAGRLRCQVCRAYKQRTVSLRARYRERLKPSLGRRFPRIMAGARNVRRQLVNVKRWWTSS